ncbi:MAG: serine hydrolase domain-containing protein [Rikenellaceae bacterium]
MNNRANTLITIVIAVIIVAVVVHPGGMISYGGTTELNEEGAPTSINMLIDNSMSEFEGSKHFDRDIINFMRRWELKGASFALMRNDSLLYAKGYGMANDTLECNVNNTFRIASASKLITATAIMKIFESGNLSLDSQVFGAKGILNDSIFLDLYSKNLEKITVEHLLRHTAGFSSPLGDPAFFNANIANFLDRDLPLSIDDMVYYATRNRLRSRPGGSYDYSNLGYIILSKIVEKVTDMSYESFVQDSILSPIGCYDIYIGRNFSENRPPNEVSYYEVKEAVPVEAYDGSGRMTMKSNGGNNVTLLSGAGGWVASSTELLRFVASINDSHVKENILSDSSINIMTHDSREDRPIGWASVNSTQWLRSGAMAGTSALIKRQKDGYTWVFISNSSAWIGHRLSNYISSHISRAISKVDEWPSQDLFAIGSNDEPPIIETPDSLECEFIRESSEE